MRRGAVRRGRKEGQREAGTVGESQEGCRHIPSDLKSACSFSKPSLVAIARASAVAASTPSMAPTNSSHVTWRGAARRGAVRRGAARRGAARRGAARRGAVRRGEREEGRGCERGGVGGEQCEARVRGKLDARLDARLDVRVIREGDTRERCASAHNLRCRPHRAA